LYDVASHAPVPVLTPFVDTLTHFCKPVLPGLGFVRLPKVLPELYRTVESLGLKTFCPWAEKKTSNT
jgi:hypothetical protein